MNILNTLSEKVYGRTKQRTFSLSLYSPPKPYMEVRYFVNDSYMTVLGNPQDPVYVPIVMQGSGNSTPSCTPHFPALKERFSVIFELWPETVPHRFG